MNRPGRFDHHSFGIVFKKLAEDGALGSSKGHNRAEANFFGRVVNECIRTANTFKGHNAGVAKVGVLSVICFDISDKGIVCAQVSKSLVSVTNLAWRYWIGLSIT